MEMIKAENLSYEYIKVTETEKGTKEEKILALILLASVVWYEVNEKRNRFEITIVKEYKPEIP